MSLDLIRSEREKYENVWNNPAYRRISPGEIAVNTFLQDVKLGESVLDIGCGSGRAARVISKTNRVQGFDIASNCLDKDIDLDLHVGCLWSDKLPIADVGYCTDVMEHIPEMRVNDVLNSIHSATKRCYFRIYLHKDNGKFSTEPLHLTVKPADWWLGRLTKYWSTLNIECNGTVLSCWCE